VAWISQGTSPGLAVTAVIPPVFDAYATVMLPEGAADQERYNRAVLELLGGATADGQSAGQRWWLGYLRTSDGDTVCPGVAMAGLPTVTLYSGQEYVLVEAGPQQAASWRRREAASSLWGNVLPDLMFPVERSWLFSAWCDDDWACVGGSVGLVEEFVAHPDLRARVVRPGEEATPPGHRAF
jgi:hypothetical protein